MTRVHSLNDNDVLGSARVAVRGILLSGGCMDLELQMKGKPYGAFITLLYGNVGSWKGELYALEIENVID
jgi:hypothetical protein